MFWGLILKSNKKYTQVLEKSFHLSQASLDHSSSDNEPVQVMYTHDDNSYLLCTLQKGKTLQVQLDLNFQEGDKLCFSTKGNGIVHLTGFLLPEDDFDEFDDMDMDSEEEEESEKVDDLRQKLSKKDKKKEKQTAKENNKKQAAPEPKQNAEEDSESDDEDFELEEGDSDEEENDTTLDQTAEKGDKDSDDNEEDESDEEDDSEEESDDAEPEPPKAKQQKLDSQQNGKKQKQNGLENGKKEKQPQPQKDKSAGDGKQQKLQGGLIVQDLKVGTGAEAKPGKKIQVYYEGRLKSNNKIFDATKSGPGFKMTLGRGEVIKGWDIGLNGLKVGGKRRLICPPGLAYGAKGNPPVIPQNSTLVFDVELKNVL